MKVLTQKLKDGIVEVLEVPLPLFGSGEVLVRNVFSLISAGTESSTVSAARKSLIGKAKERPQQVRQVLDVLVQQGPVQAYRAVMKKLDAWSPLGYSCVGEVIDLASDVSGFQIGDWVACGGLTAPKQEKWIYQNKDRLNVKFIGAIGAVFDFYAGTVKRPHPWFLDHGLEWLPRLLGEPRRLWKRMFVSAPLFMARVLAERMRR
jgi:threonine dehydrogenase-like Zn-dependent dehydrogenase